MQVDDELMALVLEQKRWIESAPRDEFRYVLFGVPHVIKLDPPYLVVLQGLPPMRRRTALAVIGKVKQGEDVETMIEFIRRSGIFGLTSTQAQAEFDGRFRKWWEAGLEAAQEGGTEPEPPETPDAA